MEKPLTLPHMSRFSLDTLPKEQRIQLIAEFYDTVASLKNRDETRTFLRGLLSGSEIAMLMRRVETAALILAGCPDRAIEELTGIGRSTMRTVKKKLEKEETAEGYHSIVNRLLLSRKKRIQKNQRREQEKGSAFAALKKRYKTHYLLNTILDEIIDYQERKGSALTQKVIRNTPSRKM